MSARRIHYAGAVTYALADGSTVDYLAGWAACCSGAAAEKIRRDGAHSFDAAAVTCGRCRANLARAAAYAGARFNRARDGAP